MSFFPEWIRKWNMTKLIFLNAKINEITKANEMKNEYWNAVDVRIEKIVTLINMTIDDKENEWENNAIDNNWKEWARKTDMKRRCTSSIFTDIALFVKS